MAKSLKAFMFRQYLTVGTVELHPPTSISISTDDHGKVLRVLHDMDDCVIHFPICIAVHEGPLSWIGFKQHTSTTGVTSDRSSREPVEKEAGATSQSGPTSLCHLPDIAGTALCVEPDLIAMLSSTISEEFRRLDNLFQLSTDAPKVVRDIRDTVIAIEDLVILVRHSDLKNKAVIMDQLQFINRAGRKSSHLLQVYTARLSSALGVIIASASFTTDLVEENASLAGLAKSFFCAVSSPFYTCQNKAHDAFVHTIHMIEVLIRKLGEYNAATDDSLILLEEHIRGVADIVGEELHEVAVEIGELLDRLWMRLWMRLGRNNSRLLEAKLRFEALARVGYQTRILKTVVWNVREELDALQLATDELRAGAAESLLLQELIPHSRVVEALAEGAQKLRKRLNSQNLEDLPSIPLITSVGSFTRADEFSM
ncbi:hypothetical protein BDN72DRAFT_904560 [Pluteus cervinus]|uniref:Uncharacterized protein n=1 Tax=Pluteus cervinus TaxID=181527 RepID=A0ACD3A7W8_9AGAR|nr:hypothetical protein BDN72DRAFT_904560 [Pluteus cervinus]